MYNSGNVFQRINRYWVDSNGSDVTTEKESRFVAFDAINNKTFVAWPTEYNGSKYIIFVNTDNPKTSYTGWWSNTVATGEDVTIE